MQPKIHLAPKGALPLCATRTTVTRLVRYAANSLAEFRRVPQPDRCARCDAIVRRIGR